LAEEQEAGVGRPRQPDIDERIKNGAVALLGEHGFAGLSVNRICKRVGIPRPTFYRRWPSGVAALIDAFNDRFDDALLTDGGNVEADLFDFAARVRDRYDDPVVSVCLPAIYEARRIAPDLIAPIAEAQRARRRANVATLTGALHAQGFRPTMTPFEILFTLTSAMDQAYLADWPLPDAFLKRLIRSTLS
jgi:AcrR family transcriptional regulator